MAPLSIRTEATKRSTARMQPQFRRELAAVSN
jgi:hypothetical protein